MTVDDAAIERLVAAAQAGEPEAFGCLFDQYYERVYRYIVSRVGSPTDAEDLTQVVFVKVLEALPRFERRGVPFGGWLFKLARNVVIDFVRSRRDHVDLGIVEHHADDVQGPDDLAALRQELDAVGRALLNLTDEQREVIELRFFAGLSAKETAEAMGKQDGTVRGLQFRALGALRRELGVDASGPGMPRASGGT